MSPLHTFPHPPLSKFPSRAGNPKSTAPTLETAHILLECVLLAFLNKSLRLYLQVLKFFLPHTPGAPLVLCRAPPHWEALRTLLWGSLLSGALLSLGTGPHLLLTATTASLGPGRLPSPSGGQSSISTRAPGWAATASAKPSLSHSCACSAPQKEQAQFPVTGQAT